MSNPGSYSSSYINNNGSSAMDENGTVEPVQPRRLELSLNPEDGSLLTAPLLSVVLSATDGLYSDLYNMIQGEIDVTTAIVPDTGNASTSTTNATGNAGAATATGELDEDAGGGTTQGTLARRYSKKRERMSKLSFAERRHELSWRLIANGRTIQHVAALCAASASSNIAEVTSISSKALQHTRTAWVQADEAQDALFFFHAQLFPGRASPHDVYGALDVLCAGHWYDLPRDLLLSVDRYETSPESSWSKTETDQRWQLAVRDKLLTGEVGWIRRKLLLQKQQQQGHKNRIHLKDFGDVKQPLWKVSLRGGIVKLTHGKPKYKSRASAMNEDGKQEKEQQSILNLMYPLEATLTVFPGHDRKLSEWTLLSIDIHIQAKTGEFNHQLETSNRQRYDLHRLAALAMSREELRHKKEEEKEKESKTSATVASNCNNPIDESHIPPSQPLSKLFQVAHTFSLSWQLELLSAQAQALRRGVWAAADSNLIQVTPVRFFENYGNVLGVVAISFWKVDDSYGPPSIGDIYLDEENTHDKNTHHLDENASHHSSLDARSASRNHGSSTNQLTLSIRAEVDVGIRVALSGAASIMDELHTTKSTDERVRNLRATVQTLLDNASNPFSLSASDALLAATKLCSEIKCRATVEALQPTSSHQGGTPKKRVLPSWIRLSVDRGSISVGARIRYHGVSNIDSDDSDYPILFQLMCDARTGTFVTTFPRSMHLIRKLAGNDVYQASEAMAARITSLPEARRKAAGALASGRMVRDAFEALIRSMNLLGQRVGVGGNWENIDDRSSYLRDRAIQTACLDVTASMSKCCGMTALYGLSPLAFGVATGVDGLPDVAGDAIDSLDSIKFITAPPISMLLDQKLVESSRNSSDGVKILTHMEQSFFSIVCSVNDSAITLYPLDVTVHLASISSVPERKETTLLKFTSGNGNDNNNIDSIPLTKRQKTCHDLYSSGLVDIMEEVATFAEILTDTMNYEYE